MNGACVQRGYEGPLYNSGNFSLSLKLLHDNIWKNLSYPSGFIFKDIYVR